MTRRSATALAIAAVLGAVSQAVAATPPRGVEENCSTRSEAKFPGAFTSPRNLVVGPLVLTGAGGVPAWTSVFPGNKFPLLVKAGHRVTVALSVRTRRFAGLAYGPLPQGEVRLRDTHRVVTFTACTAGEDSGSSADGRPVTFWSGGVVTLRPRCVPLLVWIDDAPSPRRVVIRLGMPRCSR